MAPGRGRALIDTGEWLSNPALWGNTNADLQAYANNGLDGWTLGFDGSFTSVGGRREWRFEIPRLSAGLSLLYPSFSVRPPQTISVTDIVEGNPVSTHFCLDLRAVSINPSGSTTQTVYFYFRSTKVASSAYSAANGNGAQPDFDVAFYDPVSGDQIASATGVIATTGLGSTWLTSYGIGGLRLTGGGIHLVSADIVVAIESVS